MSWKSILKSVAPALGTAVGGPMGGVAMKVISSALFGADEKLEGPALEEKIQQTINNDPDALLKLKTADQDFKTKMAELGVDLERIAADDRANARGMQKETKSWIIPILAGLTVACFFGVVFWVLTGKVTLESTLLGFILGQVSSKAEQVYNFFFGSSAGSKAKTEMMGLKVQQK